MKDRSRSSLSGKAERKEPCGLRITVNHIDRISACRLFSIAGSLVFPKRRVGKIL
jgi:hypothetical protein